MANNKNNVSVGKPKIGGAVWRAPSGTTAPADATSTLEGFVCMGYVSTDGMVNSNNKTITEIKAWGGDTVAVPVTNHSDTFTGTFIESLNPETLKAAYGDDNVSGSLSSGITVQANGKEDTEHVYVIDQELNGNVKKRIVISAGLITNVGDVTYKDDTVIGYPLTITALPDANKNTHYEYMASATS